MQKLRVTERNVQFHDDIEIREIPRKESLADVEFTSINEPSEWEPNLIETDALKKPPLQPKFVISIIIATSALLIAGVVGVAVGIMLSQKTTYLTYGQACGSSSQCDSSAGLICTGTCTCSNSKVWNVSSCVCPSGTFLNASNLCETAYSLNHSCTTGSNQCDSTKGLFCSNSICQCNFSTQYWNTNYLNCSQRLSYTQMCVFDSDCIPTLVCPILPGVCTCPQYLPDLVCNCDNTKYYNSTSTQCQNRASIGGSCVTSANYTCLTSLYCNSGTCACPTGTSWISGNSTCVATG